VTLPDLPASAGDQAPATGHPRIDAALGALSAAGEVPPDQMIAPLTEADRVLRETLDAVGDD
jgi:hypothetical protein